jgi:hypothetical protein
VTAHVGTKFLKKHELPISRARRRRPDLRFCFRVIWKTPLILLQISQCDAEKGHWLCLRSVNLNGKGLRLRRPTKHPFASGAAKADTLLNKRFLTGRWTGGNGDRHAFKSRAQAE